MKVVAVSKPKTEGETVDVHRLGKLHDRLLVTPNLDHLLQRCVEDGFKPARAMDVDR